MKTKTVKKVRRDDLALEVRQMRRATLRLLSAVKNVAEQQRELRLTIMRRLPPELQQELTGPAWPMVTPLEDVDLDAVLRKAEGG